MAAARLQATGRYNAEFAEDTFRQLSADKHPHLAEMFSEHAMKPGYNYAAEFEFGLDLILDSLERLQHAA